MCDAGFGVAPGICAACITDACVLAIGAKLCMRVGEKNYGITVIDVQRTCALEPG